MPEKTLKNLGEFKWIEEIRRKTRASRSVVLGIGDDTAIVKTTAGKDILFTTDMLVEGRHFRLKEAAPYEIGWKAMAVNLSDIAAMAGMPTQAVVSVGLPKKLPIDFVRQLYRGIAAIARRFGVSIVGGDTNAAEKIVLSVALLGEAEKGKALRRSGAKDGDVIFVSGNLGGSYISRKHLNFVPKIEEARFLARNFKIHAMMDISDGLSSDIRRLTDASRVGAWISAPAVPISPFAGSLRHALEDGEDFELLFTLSPKEAARLSLHPRNVRKNIFRPVGKIVPKGYGVRLVKKGGSTAALPERGFDHFA